MAHYEKNKNKTEHVYFLELLMEDVSSGKT
jgi:hypothetical protein